MTSTARTTANGFVKSLTQLTTDDFNPSRQLTMSSDTSSSGDSFFSNLTWQFWLTFIFILAVFGINVFAYLSDTADVAAKGTDQVVNFISPVLKFFGYQTLETTKQTVNVSATGTKTTADIVADTTTSSINNLEGTVTPATQKPMKIQKAAGNIDNAATVTKLNAIEDEHVDALDIALSSAKNSKDVLPDDAQSSIQYSGKSGWCFVGKDRGNRICTSVGVNDQCLSGDIFPSQEICMNPSLRP